METIGIIVSLTLTVLIGLVVFVLLTEKNKYNILLLLAISYGVGNSIIAIQMLAYSFFMIPLSLVYFYLPWLLIAYPAFKVLREKKFFQKKSSNYDILSQVLIFLILLLLGFGLFQVLTKPVSAWDAIASWYLGGKAFFLDQAVLPSFYKYVVYDYPPFMHFILSNVNFFQSKFNDTSSLLLYYLFYPSTLIVFFFMLREHLNVLKSLLFTFLLASVQNFTRHAFGSDIGNADLPLSYFMLLSIYFMLKYKTTLKLSFLLFSLISFVSCALIKNDGIPFALGGYFILLIYNVKNKYYKRTLLLPIVLLPLVYWRVFSVMNGLPGSYLNFADPHINRLGIIFTYFVSETLNFQRWNFAWIFVYLSFFYIRNKINIEILYLILLQLFSYAYVYMVTPIPVVSHILNSFDRLLLQILPVCLYFSIILVFISHRNRLK